MVFDSNIHRHHHVIDEDTGKIYEMPGNDLKVTGEKSLKDFQIGDFQASSEAMGKEDDFLRNDLTWSNIRYIRHGDFCRKTIEIE